MSSVSTFCALIAFLVSVALVRADLPVHCLPDNVPGTWVLKRGNVIAPSSDGIRGKCAFTDKFDASEDIEVVLSNPNIVEDVRSGAKGTWTNIYDQGFEIKISGRVYFAFFSYEKSGSKVISHCGQTFTGSYHDASAPTNWGCFSASKTNGGVTHTYTLDEELVSSVNNRVFTNNFEYIEALNKAQSSWIAGPAPAEFEGKTMDEIFKLSGSVSKANPHKNRQTRDYMIKQRAANKVPISTAHLPENLDWRNVSGENFVTPVRNQGSCGSCWIFGAVESLQDRVMVQSKRSKEYVLSPQHIGDCSLANPQYGQGCEGGFPYLASKWVHDFGGVTHEKCYSYAARDQRCKESISCDKPSVDVVSYKYVGGYYGGANEADMMEDVATNGPSIIGIMVLSDFFHYRGGIYRHTRTPLDETHVGRWVEINHAVELVGYGVEPKTGEKYWIIKNSWGTSWGMGGYGYILRGVDEIGIESCVVSAIPRA